MTTQEYLQMDKVTFTSWENKFRITEQKWKNKFRITEKKWKIDLQILNRNEKCKGKWTRVNTKNNNEKSITDYAICSRELVYVITSSVQYDSPNRVMFDKIVRTFLPWKTTKCPDTLPSYHQK